MARAGAPTGLEGWGSSPFCSLVSLALALAGLEADPAEGLVGTVAGRTAQSSQASLLM